VTPGVRVQHRRAEWYGTIVARPHNIHAGVVGKEPVVQDGAFMVAMYATEDLRELGSVTSTPDDVAAQARAAAATRRRAYELGIGPS